MKYVQDVSEKYVVVEAILAAKARDIVRLRLHGCSCDASKGAVTAALGVMGKRYQIHTSRSYRDIGGEHLSVWVYGREGVLCWEGNDPTLLDAIEAIYATDGVMCL